MWSWSWSCCFCLGLKNLVLFTSPALVVKLLPLSGRGMSLVFLALLSLQNLRGSALARALNTRGEKIANFRYRHSRSFRKRYDIGPWLL